jgi:hypothetical protein
MTLITADPQLSRPPRPASVTVAFWLQIGAVGLLLGLIGLAVAHAVYFDEQISRAVALVPARIRSRSATSVRATSSAPSFPVRFCC